MSNELNASAAHPGMRADPAPVATPSMAILLACSFAFIIVQMDVTIVNVALPRIGRELGSSVSDLQWVVDSYTVGFAAFLLSAGAISDKFGSKRVFLAGFALFAAASVACAMAPAAAVLNIARAFQGLGAALLVPSSLAILNACYGHDKKMLAKAIGWWTAAGGVSIAAGPVVGAFLLSVAGWRSIFWVNVPICILGFLLTRQVVPALASKISGRSFDVAGQLLAIVALSALVGASIEVQALGLSNTLVRAGLLLAVLVGTAFLVVEHRSAEPMLPLSLFRQGRFSCAVLFGVLVNFTYYGIVFVLSFYLQEVRRFSVIETGLMFLPLTGTFIISNIVSGGMTAQVGLRAPMMLGGLIACVGYGMLGARGISTSASFLDMLPGLVLIPAGMGLAVPAMTMSILSSIDRSQAGTASAVLNAARQVGGAIGVAIFGAMVVTDSMPATISGIRDVMFTSCVMLAVAAMAGYWCGAPRGPVPTPAPSR